MPYAQVEGARLWYQDSGGSGPPVVLLHGAAGASEIWDEQAELLHGAGFRCLRYDLRGFGRSQAQSGGETAGSVAGDLEELGRALSLGRFFLVGHAFGGFGALEFALDNPNSLLGLVVSTSFGGLTDPEYAALRARHVPPDVNRRPLAERELGASFRAANPQGVRRFLAMAEGNERRPDGRQQLRRELTLRRLEDMRVPALLIAADEDVFAPPPVMRAMAGRIPGCEFAVIEGAGHCAYFEKPREWNRLVVDFLRRCLAGSSRS